LFFLFFFFLPSSSPPHLKPPTFLFAKAPVVARQPVVADPEHLCLNNTCSFSKKGLTKEEEKAEKRKKQRKKNKE